MISYNYHIIMQEILEAGERLDRGCRDACLSYGEKQKKKHRLLSWTLQASEVNALDLRGR